MIRFLATYKQKTPLGLAMGGFLWALTGITNAWSQSGSTGELSIADIASGYEGNFTRPFFPDISLWLPFEIQMVASIVVILVMVILGLFFKRAHLLVMFLTTFTILRHLLWRIVETMDFSNPINAVLGWIIYGAEILAFFSLILGYFQIVGSTNREPIPIDDTPPENLPTVDVMLCTYNEPINVLYRSIVGCLNMDYPKMEIYLCDDGNRPEMAQLAQSFGVHYISREKNTHAKAGNLNNAMKLAKGDLVLVLDADHVPCKTFLKETVGFFNDEKLAFVQTPQHFYTTDPFQRNLIAENVINNEQDLFFHVIEPGNDYWDAAFFAGSGAVFRRSALDEIEGFAVETITEDVHTGLRLHAKGWKSIYYNKDLSAGMAQDNFSDFVKQRIRWSRGMTQILFFDNPWFVKGLSLAQRICYFASIWYFFHGLPRIVFLIAPLFFLLFGLMTINAGVLEVLTFYAPSFICLMLGYSIVSRGMRQSFWSEMYETAMCIYMFQTNVLTLLFPKRAKFRVTPKEGLNTGVSFNWRIVFPQMLIGLLIIFGIGFAVVRAIYSPEFYGGIFTNLFWSVYNLTLIIGAIYVAQERPQFRLSPRIFRQVRCELRLLDGSIAVGNTTNISESGVAVVFEEPIPVSGTLSLKILDWDIDELSVMQVQAVRSSRDESGRFYVGFRVVGRTDEQHQQLVKHMFSSASVWDDTHVRTSTGRSFVKMLATPLRLSDVEEKPSHRRTLRMQLTLSCMLEVEQQQLVGFSSQISETGIGVYIKEGVHLLELGQIIRLQVQWSNGHISDLQAEIRRIDRASDGQYELGLNFVNLSREQRLDVIHQIYHTSEGLVRVAPPTPKIVSCNLINTRGEATKGITREMSEMGAVIGVENPEVLLLNQDVTFQIQWSDEEISQYKAVVKDIAHTGQGNLALALLYFKDLDLQTLDMLSKNLHEPIESKAFNILETV